MQVFKRSLGTKQTAAVYAYISKTLSEVPFFPFSQRINRPEFFSSELMYMVLNTEFSNTDMMHFDDRYIKLGLGIIFQTTKCIVGSRIYATSCVISLMCVDQQTNLNPGV